MEGLRKGSLFPFPEKGRGEGAVPRRFLHPAGGPGQEGSLPASGGAVLHGFRLPGRGVSSFEIRSSPGRAPSFCKFCLLPDDRWAICPCAPYAVPCRKVRWSRPCGAGRTGDGRDSCSGAAPFSFMVRRSGAWSLACRPGCPGRTGAGMTRERPGKSGFSGREQKKTLPFAPAWDMDFRLCAGSGGIGPLTPHETNLRSYRC